MLSFELKVGHHCYVFSSKKVNLNLFAFLLAPSTFFRKCKNELFLQRPSVSLSYNTKKNIFGYDRISQLTQGRHHCIPILVRPDHGLAWLEPLLYQIQNADIRCYYAECHYAKCLSDLQTASNSNWFNILSNFCGRKNAIRVKLKAP